MNADRVDELLLESEGTSLDFKSEQYRFVKANDDEKSELLKDILAFANAFRRTDAYILISVKEVKGQPAEVVGIEDHLDDADLQQFVTSKTNRRLEFSYEVVATKSGSVGVIRIPRQERPLFPTRAYGRVKKGVVYYRLGSSTAEATPDVIAKMGAHDAVDDHQQAPTLHLEVADLDERRVKGTSIVEKVIAYEHHDAKSLPDHTIDSGPFGVSFHHANRNYWRELAEYIRISSVSVPFGLFVENRSSTIARNVVVTASLACSLGIEVYDALPEVPESSWLTPGMGHIPVSALHGREPAASVAKYGNTWSIVFRLGDIQPNRQSWSEGPIYLGPYAAESVAFEATISADNLPMPCIVQLNMKFDVEHREALTIERLKELHDERLLREYDDEGGS